MALVYRAIWQDDRANLADEVQRYFASWVKDRSAGKIVIREPGSFTAEIGTLGSTSKLDVSSEAVQGGGGQLAIVRNSYVLTTSKGERWHTLVRAWTDDAGGWCWVDNSVVGDHTLHSRSIDVISPLIARELIGTSVNPRIGEFPISVEPQRFSGPDAVDRLAELVTDFERKIPVVVFARCDARVATMGGRDAQTDIINDAAKNLAGIAIVIDADEDVADGMSDLLGRDFGVFNGAFRVYARDVDPAVGRSAFRHRYVTADRYMWDRKRAVSLAGRIVGPESTLRRPPSSFDEAKIQLNHARSGFDDFEQMFLDMEREYNEAKDEVIELRREKADLQEVLEEWESEGTRFERQLEYAKKLLIVNGIFDDFEDDGAGGFYAKPPQTAAQTVQLVTKYLSDRVEIHPEALRGEKQMDKAQVGSTWAETAWQGFKALYRYAEFMAEHPQENVDFGLWCEGRNNTSGWSADKVARGESGITKRQQRGTRTFPVSVKVTRNEQTEMVQHLKIQKSGNQDIPRVYFMYSPRTKKVHVGFYGPHELVPNTKS